MNQTATPPDVDPDDGFEPDHAEDEFDGENPDLDGAQAVSARADAEFLESDGSLKRGREEKAEKGGARTGTQVYMAAVSRTKMLSREEVTALAHRWRDHQDLAARNRIIDANLRLVISKVKPFLRDPRANFEDLVSAGNEALTRAVSTYDPKFNCALSTWAGPQIFAALCSTVVRQGNLIAIPKGFRAQVRALRGRAEEAEQAGDAEQARALHAELAAKVKGVEAMFFQGTSIASLDAAAFGKGSEDDDGVSLASLVQEGSPDPEQIHAMRQTLEHSIQALARLPERVRQATALIYGLNDDGECYDLDVAARALRVSRERARQLSDEGFQMFMVALAEISLGIENVSTGVDGALVTIPAPENLNQMDMFGAPVPAAEPAKPRSRP